MNYQKIYDALIKKASQRTKPTELTENHHIKPKLFGGSNHKDNLVALTLREHYFAHLLLYKINKLDYKKASKMLSALNRMSNSGRYKVSSRYYEIVRNAWIENHPCKDKSIKKKIIKSLRATRLKNGYKIIYCACGCGAEVQVAQSANKVAYINTHKPIKPVYSSYHKCACGCGKNTYLISKPENKNRIIFKCGHGGPSSSKISKTLSATLNAMDKSAMSARMRNSVGTADPKKRGEATRKGKGSQFRLYELDGTYQDFWTYDDVKKISGYLLTNIRYRIQKHNGILTDGRYIKYLHRYKGNDKNIGTTRPRKNNSI